MADLLLAIVRQREAEQIVREHLASGIHRGHRDYLKEEYLSMRGLQHLAKEVRAPFVPPLWSMRCEIALGTREGAMSTRGSVDGPQRFLIAGFAAAGTILLGVLAVLTEFAAAEVPAWFTQHSDLFWIGAGALIVLSVVCFGRAPIAADVVGPGQPEAHTAARSRTVPGRSHRGNGVSRRRAHIHQMIISAGQWT
jgi:hypothetical protein